MAERAGVEAMSGWFPNAAMMLAQTFVWSQVLTAFEARGSVPENRDASISSWKPIANAKEVSTVFEETALLANCLQPAGWAG